MELAGLLKAMRGLGTGFLDETTQLGDTVREIFSNHPSSRVHAAAGWLLRSWGLSEDELAAMRSASESRTQNWRVAEDGSVLAKVEAPDGLSFEFSMTEITVEQYAAYAYPSNLRESRHFDEKWPIHSTSPQDAMRYCNWLTKKAGLPSSEYCYESRTISQQSVLAPRSDHTQFDGYRLPTETEYRIAAGLTSDWLYPHGNSIELLDEFCWYSFNSNGRFHSVSMKKPVGVGVFDVLGNASEWTFQPVPGGDCEGPMLIGGFFGTTAEYTELTTVHRKRMLHFPETFGTFRIARTLKPKSDTSSSY